MWYFACGIWTFKWYMPHFGKNRGTAVTQIRLNKAYPNRTIEIFYIQFRYENLKLYSFEIFKAV